jgi:hypothetical protein
VKARERNTAMTHGEFELELMRRPERPDVNALSKEKEST